MTKFVDKVAMLLFAAAVLFLTAALLVEFGVQEMPIWPGQMLVFPEASGRVLTIGMIFAALAVCLYVARRTFSRR